MFSLRSILLAAAAFATLTSAIPTPETTTSSTGTGLSSVPALGGIVGGAGGGLPTSGLGLGARGEWSAGDHIKDCHEKVHVKVKKIHEVCGEKDFDHKIVIGLLWEIVELLKDLLKVLKIVGKVELLLGGVVCTIKELAAVIGLLLILLIEVIFVVFSVIGFLEAEICEVIAIIGGLLVEILLFLFLLLEGLLIEIVVIITPYHEHCKFIKFFSLLDCLHIV